jgi:hypothetical protein
LLRFKNFIGALRFYQVEICLIRAFRQCVSGFAGFGEADDIFRAASPFPKKQRPELIAI